MTDTIEETTCSTCPNTFIPKTLSVLGQVLFTQKYCPTCVEAENQRLASLHKTAKDAHDAREDAWAELCDFAYRTVAEGGITDPNRLRTACPKIDKILGWKFGHQGLLLHGETGKGKTRAIWRLLRRLFDEGKTICAMTSAEFGRQYADAAGNFTRSAWFASLVAADVLFVDDLGKSEWTAGAWGEFFDLVETFGKKGKPIILTTNETGDTLNAKAKDANTWGPLYRRLNEFQKVTV